VGCPYRSKALSFNSYEKFIKLRVRKAGVTEVEIIAKSLAVL